MKTLSPQDEARLLEAVDKTSSFVCDDGMSPDDAVVKVAKEFNLPRGHVSLVANAYNTGQTAAMRQSGKSALEKAADFPMVDVNAVLSQLYPDEVKSAAEVERETQVHADWHLSPAGWQQREKTAIRRARTLPPMVESPPEPYPGEAGVELSRKMSRANDLRKAAEEARRKASAAMDTMTREYGKLRTYFRQLGRESFGDLQKAAAMYFGDAGDKVAAMMAEDDRVLAKQAATGQLPPMDSEPVQRLAQVIKAAKSYRQAVRDRDAAEKAAADFKESVHRPFAQTPVSSVLSGQPIQSDSEKSAIDLGHVNLAANVAQGMGGGDRAGGFLGSVADPQHENQLRQIQAKATLNSLLAGDEVIGGHDQDEVLSHYNNIIQAMPRAANNKMLLQAALRRSLEQGSMDTHEVDQLLGVDQKLRSQAEGANIPEPQAPQQRQLIPTG